MGVHSTTFSIRVVRALANFLLPVKGDGGSGTLVNVYLFLLVIFKISYTLIKSKCFVFINYCCPFTIFAVILAAVL